MGNSSSSPFRKKLKEKDGSDPIYLDSSRPTAERVQSLLAFMTLDEK